MTGFRRLCRRPLHNSTPVKILGGQPKIHLPQRLCRHPLHNSILVKTLGKQTGIRPILRFRRHPLRNWILTRVRSGGRESAALADFAITDCKIGLRQNPRRAGGNRLFSEISQSLIAQLDADPNPKQAAESSSSPEILQQPAAKFDSSQTLGEQPGIRYQRQFRSSLLQNSIPAGNLGGSLYNHPLLKLFSNTMRHHLFKSGIDSTAPDGSSPCLLGIKTGVRG